MELGTRHFIGGLNVRHTFNTHTFNTHLIFFYNLIIIHKHLENFLDSYA